MGGRVEVVRVELTRKHTTPRVEGSVIRLQCSEYPGVIVSVGLEGLLFVKSMPVYVMVYGKTQKKNKCKQNKYKYELLLF